MIVLCDFMEYSMSRELLRKEELLDFLSELLAEVFEEQGQIREQIQNCNEEIKKTNQLIAEIIIKESADESAFSPSDAKKENKKKEYFLHIGTLQTRIFDLQDRMVYIQDRIEKIKSLSVVVDEQAEVGNKREYSALEKIRILETQEIERKRISMELHDTTVQNLTTLVHKIELCTKLFDIDLIRVKMEMQTMADTLRQTINELREVIYQLRPMSIEDIGLIATLQKMIKLNELEDGPLSIKLNVINKEIQIDSVINITLFRIIQEAFQNTKKYAKATEFVITIIYEEDHIDILLQDNGIGFGIEEKNKHNREKGKHFGLSMMEERIELLSGTINIDSEKNKGTRIQIEVPVL